MARLIRCMESDCFQNVCGTGCGLLTEKPRGRECPFKKSLEEVEKGREAAHQRLEEMGAWDLIDQYENNPLRRW